MSFWKYHSTKIFVILAFLFSGLILFLDIKATDYFGFTFEEEIFFPVFGIMLMLFSLIILNKKVSQKKSKLLDELHKMSFVSKIFALSSLFFFIITLVLLLFQDFSLFNLTAQIISEEQFFGLAMLLSNLVFLINYTKEISRTK